MRLRDFGPTETARAVCDLTPGGYRMQEQQLTWTVRTATGSVAPVRVLVGERVIYRAATADERVPRVDAVGTAN